MGLCISTAFSRRSVSPVFKIEMPILLDLIQYFIFLAFFEVSEPASVFSEVLNQNTSQIRYPNRWPPRGHERKGAQRMTL
jgi:hypothetical protein